MKNWENFCAINKIGSRFKDAKIEKIITINTNFDRFSKEFLAKPESGIFFGNPGTGKTYALIALMRKVVENKHASAVRYFKSTNLDTRILDEIKNYGSSLSFIESLCEVPFLFIDDFGVDRDTERMGRNMYEIIDTRWENERPIIISTNLNIKDLTKKYGDRLISRMKDSKWVCFDGNDLRGTNVC